ncbi:MAG: transporter ATP-binding protein [Modestobacter sp.]|jgi:spermidine/putrescine ABC transporter ATP-binding subunit|nr:transporter ATP-binding protein [Modestobacter sp.]
MSIGAPETTGLRSDGREQDQDRAVPAGPAHAGTLELRGVRKQYGTVTAVQDVTLNIAAGEFVTLLGSSGSGKTTTLLMIAGFEQPTSGELVLDGRRIDGLPPHRRNIGMMFQSYSLFPHMTVEQNIAYPLKIRKKPKAEIREAVREALDLVHLSGYGKRYPTELSGGQQQRIALARATVYRPPLLLMDEPLSALDRRLRSSMQEEIRRIHRDLGTTVVYVTHDQEEALALSDRVVLMHDGAVAQVGSPAEIYNRPTSLFSAGFVGESTELRGRLGAVTRHGTAEVVLSDGTVITAASPGELAAGAPVVVCVRPEHMQVARHDATTPVTGLQMVIRDKAYKGDRVQLTGRFVSGDEGLVHVAPRLAEQWDVGASVVVSWAPDNALVLPRDAGEQ